MVRKRRVLVTNTLAGFIFLACLLVGQDNAETTQKDLPVYKELDQLDREARSVNASASDGRICFYQEPYVRHVPERYNVTVVKTFVALCGNGPNEIPLNDGTNYCRFDRPVVVTKKREVFKRTYRIKSKCCCGWTGAECTKRDCDPACENGGVFKNEQCFCPDGYTGKSCSEAVCQPACANGKCIKPDVCLCGEGWTGPTCQTAICEEQCQNGGTCSAPNTCTCVSGYIGDKCETDRCVDACKNDGICVAGSCYCKLGWSGRLCEEPVCEGGCQMGGTCIAPDTCFCAQGYFGKNCEIALIKNQENDLSFMSKRQVISTISDEPDLCYTWGQHHYKTFDGKYFYFPGRCTYKLVADCVDDMFSVHVTNDPNCPEDMKCRRGVELYLGGHDIKVVLDQGRHVLVNNVNVTLPHLVEKIVVQEVASYIVVYGFSGLTIQLDGHNGVYVHMSNEYRGKTCGLCGNYNGDPSDDFITLAGHEVSAVNTFGNSFKMTDFGKTCEDVPADQDSFPCKQLSNEEYTKIHLTCATLLQAPFISCHATVDPALFIKMCEEDACTYVNYTSINTTSCDAFTQYSRACSRNGLELSWRNNLNICGVTCPATMEFSECETACPRTCAHRDVKYVCDMHCVDGCTCPNGTYHDGENCVAERECPCEHQTEVFPAGSTIQSDCNQCVCTGGAWSCTTDVCPGTCSATGDPHYRTFDGKAYSFMGHCRYIFARDCHENTFEILVENTPCGTDDTVTCTKTVFVFVNDSSIVLLRGGAVMLNGKEIALPYFTAGITLTRISSQMTRLQSDIGLDVKWDGMLRLYVTVQPHFVNKTCGLCGNYNNIQDDDFMNNDHAVETNVLAFANSWATTMCNKTVYVKNPCETMVQRAAEADKKCYVLKKEPFQVCHHSVDPLNHYIQNCKYDVCGCQDGTVCYCSALEDYAHACARHGHVINWRNTGVVPECDVLCENNEQEYHQCGTSCYETCRDLQENEGCVEECSPGCRCPNGTVLNANHKCVPYSKCLCHHDGEDYVPGASYWPDRCTICTCRNGKFDCRNETCEGVECSYGRVWSSCAQCSKTCENVNMPCLNQQCEEGCICPGDLVFDGSGCINVSKCPCHHDGHHYNSGETIAIDCNTCTCKDTAWECTTKKCPKVCSAIGDPHFKTFDGKRYQFQGSCEYILSEDYCGSGSGNYRVEIQNIPCGTSGVTCTKAPVVTLGQIMISFIRGEKPKVEALPGSRDVNLTAGYKIYESQFFTVLTSEIGLTLEWNHGTMVYVNLEPSYQGSTCGLCGNLNNNQNDDFLTPQNLPETLPSDFGDSWKVEPSCADTHVIEHPCKTNKHRAAWAYKTCNIIRRDAFQPCHDKVDPEPFFEDCYYDACGCDTGGDCECMCTAIAAYSRECNRHGIHIKWRTQELCPAQCENGLEYEACGSACPETCETLCGPRPSCPIPCTEGCHCPNGTVLHNGACIKPQACPCVVDGQEYKNGSFVISNCQNCHCNSGCLDCTGPTCAILPVTATEVATKPTISSTEKTTKATAAVTGVRTKPTTAATEVTTKAATSIAAKVTTVPPFIVTKVTSAAPGVATTPPETGVTTKVKTAEIGVTTKAVTGVTTKPTTAATNVTTKVTTAPPVIVTKVTSAAPGVETTPPVTGVKSKPTTAATGVTTKAKTVATGVKTKPTTAATGVTTEAETGVTTKVTTAPPVILTKVTSAAPGVETTPPATGVTTKETTAATGATTAATGVTTKSTTAATVVTTKAATGVTTKVTTAPPVIVTKVTSAAPGVTTTPPAAIVVTTKATTAATGVTTKAATGVTTKAATEVTTKPTTAATGITTKAATGVTTKVTTAPAGIFRKVTSAQRGVPTTAPVTGMTTKATTAATGVTTKAATGVTAKPTTAATGVTTKAGTGVTTEVTTAPPVIVTKVTSAAPGVATTPPAPQKATKATTAATGVTTKAATVASGVTTKPTTAATGVTTKAATGVKMKVTTSPLTSGVTSIGTVATKVTSKATTVETGVTAKASTVSSGLATRTAAVVTGIKTAVTGIITEASSAAAPEGGVTTVTGLGTRGATTSASAASTKLTSIGTGFTTRGTGVVPGVVTTGGAGFETTTTAATRITTVATGVATKATTVSTGVTTKAATGVIAKATTAGTVGTGVTTKLTTAATGVTTKAATGMTTKATTAATGGTTKAGTGVTSKLTTAATGVRTKAGTGVTTKVTTAPPVIVTKVTSAAPGVATRSPTPGVTSKGTVGPSVVTPTLCPNGMVFTNCAPSCEPSCQYRNTSCTTTVTKVCASGCACADGLVYNGTHCVEPSDCPCYYNNIFYKAGTTWYHNCSRCICWENKVICTPHVCPSVAFCPSPGYEVTRKNCCDVCTPVSVRTTTFVPTTAVTCDVDEFYCPSAKSCISESWLCDGSQDCPLAEDEKNCGKVTPCNKTIGEVQGYPDSSWSRNVSKSGAALYCLQKHNNSLIFEANFGYLSRVTMIGSEIRRTSLTYQNFKVNYSTDGLTWRTYFNGRNLTGSVGDLSQFKLKTPFNAHYVRIVPEHWNLSLCSRYVIFGCANVTATLAPTTIPCSGFLCNNSRCINPKWKCDGNDDCGDNSDEIGCPPVTCSENQFTCNNSKCIGIDRVCDGDDDCGDTSDEKPGCVKPTCASTQFTCNTSKCIPMRFLCDGEKDCPGGEDEDRNNCPTTQPPSCEFLCSDGTCISKTRICDYFKDCNNSMDETNCTCTNTTQWRCSRSGKCISISYICDGTEECPQGEDEENCPTVLPTTIASTVPSISSTLQPVTHLTTTPAVATPLVCVRGNKSYGVGDTWTENECYKCRCLDNGTSECTKFCSIVACPTGEVLATSPSECCYCLHVTTTTKPQTTIPAATARVTTKATEAPTTIPTAFVTTKAPVLGCVNVTCSCPQTCEDIARSSDNCGTFECIPGCQCPSGTVLKHGFCLNATTCPCYHEGKVYEFGQSYNKDVCIVCMCLSDGFSCQKKCNKSCLLHEELVTLPDQCCYCKEKCRPDMLYKQCSCPVTCENTTCDSTQCKPGCECPSGKYDDGTACVPIKDCYCIVDGEQVESGETWAKGECVRCSCTDGKEICNQTCNITTCPTGYELVHPPQGCCIGVNLTTTLPTISQTPGCYDNGTFKKVGEIWSNDRCENCTCGENNQIKCVSTACPTVCPQGCKVQQIPGKCCNECVPLSETLTCTDNGLTYNAGERWQPDPCQNCSCSLDGKVTCRIKQCPQECPVGFECRHVPGQCCPECAPLSLCTARRMTTVITDDDGCTSRNAIASFCHGPCNSNGTVSIIGDMTIHSTCHCCKPTALALKSTPMICLDGSSYLHYYPVIQQCSCTRCGAGTTDEVNQVLNSIRENQG